MLHAFALKVYVHLHKKYYTHKIIKCTAHDNQVDLIIVTIITGEDMLLERMFDVLNKAPVRRECSCSSMQHLIFTPRLAQKCQILYVIMLTNIKSNQKIKRVVS